MRRLAWLLLGIALAGAAYGVGRLVVPRAHGHITAVEIFRGPNCSASDQGQALEVTVYDPTVPSLSCAGFIQSASSVNALWVHGLNYPTSTETVVCAVTKGHQGIRVYDSGGRFLGGEVCGALVHEGWLED